MLSLFCPSSHSLYLSLTHTLLCITLSLSMFFLPPMDIISIHELGFMYAWNNTHTQQIHHRRVDILEKNKKKGRKTRKTKIEGVWGQLSFILCWDPLLFCKDLGEEYLKWVMTHTCLMDEGAVREAWGCVEGLVVCVVHIVAGWYVGNVFARSDRNPRLLPAEIWEPFSRGTIDTVCELTRVNREISVTRTKGWLVDTEVGHGKTKDWTSCKNCTTQV